MQTMLNLCGSYGLPLSVSGFAPHISLSKEMADHDLRREAIKRQRSQGGEGLHGNQEMGTQRTFERVLDGIQQGEIDTDLANLLHDLTCLNFAAKAA